MLGKHPLTENTAHDQAIANNIASHHDDYHGKHHFANFEEPNVDENEIGLSARMPPEYDDMAKYQLFLSQEDNHFGQYNNDYYPNLYRSWPVAYHHHRSDEIDDLVNQQLVQLYEDEQMVNSLDYVHGLRAKNWEGLDRDDSVADVFKQTNECKCRHGHEECCMRQYEQALRDHTTRETELLQAHFPKVKHEPHPELEKYVIHPHDGKAVPHHAPVHHDAPHHITHSITHESQLSPRQH